MKRTAYTNYRSTTHKFSMEALRETMRKMQPALPNVVIMCHPVNEIYLTATLEKKVGKGLPLGPPRSLYGVRFQTNKALPIFVQKWKFPPSRFIEYEKSDEAWAIPLGYGHWVETDERYFVMINEDEFRPRFMFGPPMILNPLIRPVIMS